MTSAFKLFDTLSKEQINKKRKLSISSSGGSSDSSIELRRSFTNYNLSDSKISNYSAGDYINIPKPINVP